MTHIPSAPVGDEICSCCGAPASEWCSCAADALSDAVSVVSVVPAASIDFTCECDTTERHAYRVTDHEGVVTECLYCDDCADLARVDWNGETASCIAIVTDEPYDRDGTPGRACVVCNTAWPTSEPDIAAHHNAGCPELAAIEAVALLRELVSR